MALSGYEKHRRYIDRKRAAAPLKECDCGCGALICSINQKGFPARFKHGHNGAGVQSRYQPGHTETPEDKEKRFAARRAAGFPMSETALANVRAASRRRKERGWRPTPEQVEELKKRVLRGSAHPFYGKKRSAEERARMSEAQKKRYAAMRPEDHPAWRGGTGSLPYGPGFTRTVKRLIRERDDYTCQRCGITQDQVSRKLDVHHIDHDKMNNHESNLVTLCSSCNIWFSWHRDEPFVRFSAVPRPRTPGRRVAHA